MSEYIPKSEGFKGNLLQKGCHFLLRKNIKHNLIESAETNKYWDDNKSKHIDCQSKF